MAIAVKPYSENLIPAVREFNHRLTSGGAPSELRFPEHPAPEWLPKANGRRIYQEYFLALDADSVRGGYILKYQDFSFSGDIRRVAYYHFPVSEGIVSRAYVAVGIQMLRAALETEPLLFALGMGGYDRPLPQMLRAMKWNMCLLPFYFKVNSPSQFLKETRALRNTPTRRLCMDLAAITGIGWLGLKLLQGLHPAPRSGDHSVRTETVSRFSQWADDLWQECKTRYAMIAVRDSETLNILYPPSSTRFLCLKVCRGAGELGWAVILDTQMQNDKYFGNLRVGSIADCLALPKNASAVIRAATRVLEERGVDLIVSNQSHSAWCMALRQAGFQAGPSNFIFAASRKLGELLDPFELKRTQTHLNRGDGDGPIHL
jgi:hypothetical protein